MRRLCQPHGYTIKELPSVMLNLYRIFSTEEYYCRKETDKVILSEEETTEDIQIFRDANTGLFLTTFHLGHTLGSNILTVYTFLYTHYIVFVMQVFLVYGGFLFRYTPPYSVVFN